MTNLLDCDFDQLKSIVASCGQPKYRAEQLHAWLLDGADFDQMTNLPRALLDNLAQNYRARALSVAHSLTSVDGTIKYLYQLADAHCVEGVFLPNNYGNTLCISTQVGCRMGCAFCASTLDGLGRDLTAGEILDQVIVTNRAQGGTRKQRAISNLVLMGSGEPLDNYDQVVRFLRMVSSPDGLGISQRNISLSTCGLVDRIISLADEGLGITLSISLHATTDEARQQIMPIARKHPIHQLMQAARHYFQRTGRRVVLEYSMIKGLNIDYFDARRLAELTRDLPCHINLIMLNPVPERNIRGCTPIEARRFCDRLTALGLSATIRRSLGSDIAGACGQLRRKFVGTKEG